jgi:RNA polymerase sigma-54 factor
MKQSLQMQLRQQLAITPQLQQAIQLLLLPTHELLAEIQQQLDSNTMLEMTEASDDTDVTPAWQESLLYKTRTTTHSQRDDNDDFSEIKDTEDTSLRSHLMWQMEMTPFSELERAIAIAIIDSLDENGYLCATFSEIKVSLAHEGVEPLDSDIEQVLLEVQQFDPVGVASRNLQEYLLLQLSRMAHETPGLSAAKNIITHHIDELAKHDYQQIRREDHISKEVLIAALNLIKSLNPRPNYEYSNKSLDALIPDLVVRKQRGVWVVELTSDLGSRIRINQEYARMIQRSDSSQDNQFLKNQLQEARWFLKSLQNRNETLLKVATCIMETQMNFLEHGALGLKPLILSTIAESTELHESTISRVTTNKYIQTPRGVFELKYFFSSQLSTDSGDSVSSTALKAGIKALISNEPEEKPLSDQKIAELMESQGIHVARRTVAKYREALQIPPSNERKRIKELV